MSSIDNNNRPVAPNPAVAPPTPTEETLEEKHLKKLLAQDDGGLQLLAMLGLPVGEIGNAVQGKPKGKPVGNKFRTEASDTHLPPPSAPRLKNLNPRAQAAYESLSQDVDQVFTKMQAKAGPLNLGLNSQNIPPNTPPDVAAQRGVSAAQNIMQQTGLLTSDAMMLAFMVLRVKDQSDGLEVQKQLADLTSKMRDRELKNEELRNKEANEKINKAMAKQAKMGILSKVLSAVMAVLTAVMAVATLGLGTGLALVATAMVIGFIAGGAKGGKDKGGGFDIGKAFDGAAMGGDIAMVACGLGAAMLAVQTALREATSQGLKAGTRAMLNTLTERFSVEFSKNLQALAGKGAMTGKGLKAAMLSITGVQTSAEIGKAGAQYAVARANIDAETAQQLAKVCEMLASILQQEWQGFMDFMQVAQESHKDAVDKALSMMTSHHNSQIRAIQGLVMG